MSNSLQNIDNYKCVFNYSTTEICSKYFTLLSEYLIQCVETIFMENKNYYKYIICKGINTISHVFKMMLLYTKNLELTYFHCQRSFYYYVEFIGQIGDDNHSFLQLNSKDAALFVYKKTIFDINNEYRREFISETNSNIIMNNIDVIIEIYNSCFSDVIMDLSDELKEKHRIIETMNEQIGKISQYILDLGNIGDENYLCENLTLIRILNEYHLSKGAGRINCIETFCRKLKKNNITSKHLKEKLSSKTNNDMYEQTSTLRYINWLMSDVQIDP